MNAAAKPRAALVLLTLSLALPARAGVDPDTLAGLKARSIGPAGMSGRIAAIDASASNPDVVWAGAATGGVWKSTNGALTFSPMFDDQPVHAIGAVAIYQANPDVVWVGTGEGNTRNSVSVGNGIYRTLDGGKTWSHLGLEKTERIYRIALHPSNPDTAWVCAPGQEWGENADRGVFKTEDGGKNWKKILYVDEKTGCGDLVLDPKNPGKLFAALWQFRRWPWSFKSGGPGSSLHVTYDGGATWKKLQEEDGLPEGELGRIGVAISASDPQIVYALVEAEKSAMLRSSDGGRTFKTMNDKPNVNPRPFYFCDLRVDPQTPNRVYNLEYNPRVSEDGGKTWALVPGASWALIHGDHHAMWIDPSDPAHMYVGNDGGIAESRDRGKSFRFVSSVPLAQYYHVAVDDDRPYHVYGGLQDNGSWRGPSQVYQSGGIRNHHFEEVGGGDGFETLPDPRDSSRGYSLSQGGFLMRWNLATGEEKLVKPAPPEGTRLRFNWNAGLAIDPFDPDTIYLGSQFLHRSQDRGETWALASPDLTSNNAEWQKQDDSGGLTPDVSGAENFTTIVAIAPSRIEKGLVWVGTDDGRVQLTRDAGKSWTSVEKNIAGVPANTWVPQIRPSRFDAGTAFVVFDNHRRSDWTPYVYKTTDYGKTWKSLATGELRGYCLTLEQDVIEKDLLFLGTEFGLYASWDGGASWSHLKKTLPTASVMDLRVHPRGHDLVIATHGRALYILDDIRPLRAMTADALAEPLHFYAVAEAQGYWSKPEDGGFGFGAGEFRGENRPYGAILTYSMNLPGLPVQDDDKERARKEKERTEKRRATAAEKGEKKEKKKAADEDKQPKVEIAVKDASGKVVRNLKAPARLGVNRAEWNLKRDDFKKLPRAEDDPREEEENPSGPEVPPGSYTISLKYAGHEASQVVQVLPDPRSRNTPSDWAARYEAILAAGALSDGVADAVARLRRTKQDIASVQERVRHAAEDAGEKDKKTIAEKPLVKSGDALVEALDGLEKRLWQAPETKGIAPDLDVYSRIGEAYHFLSSSMDPPSPTQRELLKQAGAKLAAFQGDLERVFATDVAAYRKLAVEAKIALLPEPDAKQ